MSNQADFRGVVQVSKSGGRIFCESRAGANSLSSSITDRLSSTTEQSVGGTKA